VFSAIGLLCSDIEYAASRTIFRRLDEVDTRDIQTVLAELEAQARGSLAGDGVAIDAMIIKHFAELRYCGHAYELAVPINSAAPDLNAIAASFDAEHARTYGHSSPGAPTDLVSLKSVGRAPTGRDASIMSKAVEAHPRASALPSRRAYFGPDIGYSDTPVITRQELEGTSRRGPLVIEEYDATCLVPPDAIASLDVHGNIDIQIG
jgi:N-methylhydantoinase A